MRITNILLLAVLIIGFDLSAQEIKFTKTTIDHTFVSAGVTTADIDKDGLEDVVAGDVWYKAPDWIRMEVRPLGPYYGTLQDPTKPRGSGASYYSRSIGNFTKDIDGDGWLDVIVMNSQGAQCYWYRNPGAGKFDQLWQEYLAIEEFHNESPQMVDLFGDGVPVILAGHQIGDNNYTLSWFSPPTDPTQLWDAHVIGHPEDFDIGFSRGNSRTSYAPAGRGHGLGIGDMNMDGIQDVLTGKGWYEGPKDGKTKERWKFHSHALDEMADPERPGHAFSHIFADDFDEDGDVDIIGSSSHRYGLWWFEQVQNMGNDEFVKHTISMDMSQLHGMNVVDFDGDGVDEYVFGKRYLAHLGRDPGSSDPAVVGYVSRDKNSDGTIKMTSHIIDDNAGLGTQIWISDLNKDGKPDVITSNKKGTHIFIQD